MKLNYYSISQWHRQDYYRKIPRDFQDWYREVEWNIHCGLLLPCCKSECIRAGSWAGSCTLWGSPTPQSAGASHPVSCTGHTVTKNPASRSANISRERVWGYLAPTNHRQRPQHLLFYQENNFSSCSRSMEGSTSGEVNLHFMTMEKQEKRGWKQAWLS